MHSRRLLLLLWSTALVALAAASCHLPNGQEADEEWVPCNKVDAFSLCCRDGDVCLESGQCLTPSGLEAGACQNADWVGCDWFKDHPPPVSVVDLKARQDVATTVIVVGGTAAQSTVVVIATATATQAVPSASSDPTTDSVPAATTEATARPTATPAKSKTSLGPVIGGAVAGAAVLAGFVFALFYIHRRRERKRRLDAEIRASIQSDWLGQVEVGSGKRRDGGHQQFGGEGVDMGASWQDKKPRTPPPGASGGKTPEPGMRHGGYEPVEIDDGRTTHMHMHPSPAEMESPPPPQVSNKPPWATAKGVYEIG